MKEKSKNTSIYIAYDDDEPVDLANPEKNLLRAILTAAMTDLRRSGDSQKHAMEYMLDTDEEYLFSFRSICTLLDIDHIRVLRAAGLVDEQGGGRRDLKRGSRLRPGV